MVTSGCVRMSGFHPIFCGALWVLFLSVLLLSLASASASFDGGSTASLQHNQNPEITRSEKTWNSRVEWSNTAATTSSSKKTEFVAECELPTKMGSFRMRSYIYTGMSQRLEPIVLIHGDVKGKRDVLVRVHDQCFTSEVLGSLRCDCREQLEGSMRLIKEKGGIVIYLQQEGRGIGLANKIGVFCFLACYWLVCFCFVF